MAEPTAIVPDKGIRPGFNETGSQLAKRIFVAAAAGSAPDSVALPGAGAACKGVTMEVIPDVNRGDVQVEGIAIVTAAEAITRSAQVACDAAGLAVVAATGDIIVGIARSASGGAAEDIEVELTDLSRAIAL